MRFRKSTNWRWASLSQTFDNNGINEIGHVLTGSLKLPDLGTGITSAIFHDRAKMAVANDLLNKCMIMGSIAGRLS